MQSLEVTMKPTLWHSIAAIFAVCLVAGAAHAQTPAKRSATSECQTELKPTDGYRELSAALKCLDDRLKSLEASRAGTGVRQMPDRGEVASPDIRRVEILLNNTLQVELESCGPSPHNQDLQCQFQITNLTKKDTKVCIGKDSRLVTDNGTSFSNAGGLAASLGSVEDHLSGRNAVCDTITPLSTVQSWVRFDGSRGRAKSEVQFVRLDCGPGCLFEAYKIPIK
jgi:hypothetical protein